MQNQGIMTLGIIMGAALILSCKTCQPNSSPRLEMLNFQREEKTETPDWEKGNKG